MGEMKMSNEKKKSHLLGFNVGGGVGVVLGGVVLMGGGLAVAGLMAAFSIIKKRNSAKDYQKQGDSTPLEESQGLNFVLQNPSTIVHQNSCCTNHGATTIGRTESLMDSKELVAAHNMTLGEKTLPIMDREKEILSYDELRKEINESCNEILNKEEMSLPVSTKMIKNESSENLQPMENIEIKREDEPAENLPIQFVKDEEQEQGEDDDHDGSEEPVVENEEGVAEGELALKENSPVQLVEEEEEEEVGDDVHDDNSNNHRGQEYDSEDVTEKDEESSEATGSSSMESNVEAIWPTEMIEALSRELKDINASNQNSEEKKIATSESHDYLNLKSDGSMFNEYHSNNESIKNSAMLNQKSTQELGMEKVENVNLPKREVFVWSLLVVILLLLLLHIHRTVSVRDLS